MGDIKKEGGRRESIGTSVGAAISPPPLTLFSVFTLLIAVIAASVIAATFLMAAPRNIKYSDREAVLLIPITVGIWGHGVGLDRTVTCFASQAFTRLLKMKKV